MSKLTVKIITAKKTGLLNCLIKGYPLTEWRRYRVFSQADTEKYILCRIRHLSRQPSQNTLLAVFDGEKPVGMAMLCRLSWDSCCFGIKMGAIKYLISEQKHPRKIEITNKLLQAIALRCKNNGIMHLSCRLDSQDRTALFCLPQNGFYLADTLLTYILKPGYYQLPCDLKSLCSVRHFQKNDLPEVMELARNSFLENRFFVDPHLDPRRAKNFYAQWIKNYCEDQARIAWVARRKGRIVGFLAYELNKEVRRITGKQLWGHGLGAVSPSAKGVYPAFLSFAIKQHGGRGDIIEFDALLTSIEANRVYQSLNLRLAKTQYTWHQWLG